MKLTKENVYVDLRGKSKEELNYLEDLTKLTSLHLYNYLHFNEVFEGWWEFDKWEDDIITKQEVTIEQLKEILKPMENKEEQLRKEAKERGFVNGVKFFGSQGIESDKPMLICDNICYAKPNEDIGIWGLYVNNSWLCYNGTWGTLAEETLEQQLEKAEAEVKRLREAVEDSKIKEGDWCTFWNHNKDEFIIAKFQEKNKFVSITSSDYFLNCEKITDTDLLESLNKLF